MKTKTRYSLWASILLAVLLVSCAPAASTQPSAAATATSMPSDTPTPDTLTLSPTSPPDTSTLVAPTVQFIPTSRGPDLEATDPTTVNLTSGGLQLVEFFRFT